jgi:hypothetical protein
MKDAVTNCSGHGAAYATMMAYIRLSSRVNDCSYHVAVKIGQNYLLSVFFTSSLQMLPQVICMNKSAIAFKGLAVTVFPL